MYRTTQRYALWRTGRFFFFTKSSAFVTSSQTGSNQVTINHHNPSPPCGELVLAACRSFVDALFCLLSRDTGVSHLMVVNTQTTNLTSAIMNACWDSAQTCEIWSWWCTDDCLHQVLQGLCRAGTNIQKSGVTSCHCFEAGRPIIWISARKSHNRQNMTTHQTFASTSFQHHDLRGSGSVSADGGPYQQQTCWSIHDSRKKSVPDNLYLWFQRDLLQFSNWHFLFDYTSVGKHQPWLDFWAVWCLRSNKRRHG
jgi:hypothetical protein